MLALGWLKWNGEFGEWMEAVVEADEHAELLVVVVVMLLFIVVMEPELYRELCIMERWWFNGRRVLAVDGLMGLKLPPIECVGLMNVAPVEAFCCCE